MQAKEIFDRKGIGYTEIDVLDNTARRAEMERRSGRHTVPNSLEGRMSVAVMICTLLTIKMASIYLRRLRPLSVGPYFRKAGCFAFFSLLLGSAP